MVIDWYFDFISPFSYFSALQVETLAARSGRVVEIRRHPILFAGVLKHCGQKGPAEIPSKREWTYRWCNWWARREGMPFRMTAVHPFNPIQYLRLAHALDCDATAIRAIFDALWREGADPRDPAVITALARRFDVDLDRLGEPAVKDALRARTDRAIAAGVFGVPTWVADGQRFWGADAFDFLLDFLADPGLFEDPEMRRGDSLPVGAERRLS
jgi:2-hydroxychromene-2-carboxylate isomerase